MDVKTFHLVPISPTVIARPAILETLSPDTIPSLQQLREIEKDIQEYKKQHERRLQHCETQLGVVDAQYTNMKERDRTKVKQLKKEPIDGLATASRAQKPSQPILRISGPSTGASSAQPGLPPSSATTSKPIVRAGSAALRADTTSSKLNKKKRKRAEDGEDFLNDTGMRNGTPTTKGHGHKEHKSKKAKHDDHDLRANPTGFRRINDWSESIRGGLPPRPPKNPLPVPQTDQPNEVNDDMSDRKQPPNQVTAHAYWNFVEPWTRQLKDEDVAFLAVSGDDDEFWEVPPLGRHYSEKWEDEDRFMLDLPALERPPGIRVHNPYAAFTDPPPPSAGGVSQPAANSGLRWDPASLTEADVATEEHGSGPLTERIFSAFIHIPNNDRMEEDDSYKGGPGLGRAAGQGTVGDLEERLMKECKALGLILENEEPDYAQPQDDQIASELRRCQRALRNQLQINECRKRRLMAVAELRLSYADYEEVKEGMERNISNMFSRLGSAGAPKVTKKKKKEKEKVAAAAAVNASTGEPAGISGLGLVGMDGYLQIPNEIYEPVSVLRQWKGEIGSKFELLEMESPGLIKGLPKKSIYEGLEEEIAAMRREGGTAVASAAAAPLLGGVGSPSIDAHRRDRVPGSSARPLLVDDSLLDDGE